MNLGYVKHAQIAGLDEAHHGGVVHVVGVVGVVVVVDGIERADKAAVAMQEGVGAVEGKFDRLVVVGTVDAFEVGAGGEDVEAGSEARGLIFI